MKQKKRFKNNYFRLAIALSPVIFIVVLFIGSIAGDMLLKQNGVCTKAAVIDKILYSENSPNMFYYEVFINGKKYTGDSQETDISKVGDSVCVVYLKYLPFINRAKKYFDKDEIKCDCNE